ncbi:MAG: HXXEE domain-containing protein [Pyrinomonadaceae bacterium]
MPTTLFNFDKPARWAWLLPATYLIHIAEEYWCGIGFPAWISSFGFAKLTPELFLQLNAAAWLVMTIGVALAIVIQPLRFLIVGFGAAVFINGLAHTIGSIVTVTYSPGLVSGLLIWIPLGSIILYQAWRSIPRLQFWTGIIVGVVLHAMISLSALTSRPRG